MVKPTILNQLLGKIETPQLIFLEGSTSNDDIHNVHICLHMCQIKLQT